MDICNFFFLNSSFLNVNTGCTRSVKVKCSTHRLKLADSLQEDTLKILEWPSVCSQVSAFTSTTMARHALLPIGRSPQESRKLLDQTSAAFALHLPLDFSRIEDVSNLLQSAVSSQLLSIREICAVKRTLRSARDLYEQLNKQSERLQSFGPPLLLQMSADVVRRLQTFYL